MVLLLVFGMLPLVAASAPAATDGLYVITSPPPASGSLGAPYGHVFTAGTPGAVWSVAAGTLPTGLSLHPDTGVLSGTPSVAGQFDHVTVEASWPDRYRAIAAGGLMSCGILAIDDSVLCWGGDDEGQADDRSAPHLAIALGDNHMCGILVADGSVHCSGDGVFGQSADQVGPYLAISAGNYHTCGILAADGSAHCWGDTGYGQSDDQVGPYTSIVAGYLHTCGILVADGSAHCWGHDDHGQAEDQPGPYTAIGAGFNHTCGLVAEQGSVHCWGDNTHGQSDDQVGPYRALSVGSLHNCGILAADDSVHCWGHESFGRSEDQVGPYEEVSAGGAHTCGILAVDGTAHCWGHDGSGKTEVRAPVAGADSQTFAPFVNSPPTISTVADQTVTQGASTGPLAFVVADDESPLDDLAVTAVSDDQVLLPDANLVVAGTGGSRTVEATPAADRTGTAAVTLTVTDPHGLVASTSFSVTVVESLGTITGTVTSEGEPVGDVLVAAFTSVGWTGLTSLAVTEADGTYTLDGLGLGAYEIAFVPEPSSGLAIAWYDGANRRADAMKVTVAEFDAALIGVDAVLAMGASVSGTVTASDATLEGATVFAFAPGRWAPTAMASTGPDGAYLLTNLPSDTYHLRVAAPGHSAQWYAGAATRAAAVAVIVDGTTVVDIPLTSP